MEYLGTLIRGALTAILLVLAIWWLGKIAGLISSPATRTSDGQVVDQYQRAKDILLVILPLVTTALGYWFGSAGREKAESKAVSAQEAAAKSQQKLEGVLDSTTEKGLLDAAREKYPEAFRSTDWSAKEK